MRRSQLSIEALESRSLMSASATVVNGDLWVQGSNYNDKVQVYQSGFQTFTVANLFGTGPTTTHTGVTGNVNVNLGYGNDLLILGVDGGSFTTAVDVNIDMGSSDDKVFLYSVWASDDIVANGGTGSDTFYMKDSNVGYLGLSGSHDVSLTSFDAAYTGGTATNPTTGNHAVDIKNSSIQGNLIAVSDNGIARKKVALYDVTVDGSALIQMNAGGDNWVSIANSYINKGLDIITGSGKDSVDLVYTDVGTPGDRVGANADIETGDGNDTVKIRNSSVENILNVSTGDGDDFVYVYGLTANYSSFNGGNGLKDRLDLYNVTGPRGISGFEIQNS